MGEVKFFVEFLSGSVYYLDLLKLSFTSRYSFGAAGYTAAAELLEQPQKEVCTVGHRNHLSFGHNFLKLFLLLFLLGNILKIVIN